MDIDANDFLMSTGVRSAKFNNPGDSITGFVMQPPEIMHQTDYDTREPLYYKDGRPKLQLRVILMTEERDPDDEDDSGERAIYIRGRMQKAVADAVRKAGAHELQVGGKLRVTYTRNGEATRGFPPKEYSAMYRAPEQSRSADNGAAVKQEINDTFHQPASREVPIDPVEDEIPF